MKIYNAGLVPTLLVAFLLGSCSPDGGDSTEGVGAGSQNRVTIFGAFVDEDASRFQESMQPFIERTGIQVSYEGSSDFETLVTVRVEGGDAPDIVAFPQPGLMQGLAREGALVPLDDVIDRDLLEASYADSWIELGTVDDTLVGVWYRASVKSLVWYPKQAFDEAGYEIPETWDEMIALSDQIVADGSTPWCIGIESGGATGWVATDWLEDIVLRTAGADVYDQWITNELPFNAPEIQEATEILGEIWLNPDYVLGGSIGILTTPFGDAANPMLENPPGCYLHRQASFLPVFLPDDIVIGEDIDFFYLPPINEEEHGRPVMGAGDVMAMLNDRPEVREVMQYLATAEAGRAWLEAGGFISPHNEADLDWYPDPGTRAQAELLLDADTFRFDASDMMPGSVGTGTFWTGMVDYVSGRDLKTVLTEIEDSWPQD
ncbi:MAG: ABC transporter substrate-binding protein [Cyanophyceae cyanobacterium]